MAETQLARPFQLHLFGGGVLHGVQFPTGHVAVEDTGPQRIVSAMSVGDLLRKGYNGVVLWPEDPDRLAQDSARP